MMKRVLLLCTMGLFVSMAQARADDSVTQEGKTAHYRLTLQIGPTETMYSETEAKAKHPSSGEVMLSGRMAGGMSATGHGMPGMTSMPDMRHIELHAYSLKTGKVVSDARVTIVLTGADGKRHVQPIARMYGVIEGLEDLHYGNNAMVDPGAYTVDVTINGEPARFSVTIPAGS
jgi:hypothetical protein